MSKTTDPIVLTLRSTRRDRIVRDMADSLADGLEPEQLVVMLMGVLVAYGALHDDSTAQELAMRLQHVLDEITE